MKTITDIKPQKNNPNRCNIYLDGEYFCRMELFTVMSNRLKVGNEITEEELDNIIFEAEYDIAISLALSYFARGMHSKAQFITYLKRKGFIGSIIAKTVDKMIEYGYINDEAYLSSYLRNNCNRKGKRKIEFELKSKGIDKVLVETSLNSVEDDEDAAFQIASKFLKDKVVDYNIIVKCYRRLVSRGFSYDTAKRVVERFKSESDDEID